ncbi:DUF6517 family protein [Salinarchaeum laminariae]|uniref:DUF6517 family protein n=1 Tax=Salinarchaeum laminariae TaxID=869888 RepID=UPI0020BDEB7C|nr:DUF6517 family protein [Salinarchaeum laminariae]
MHTRRSLLAAGASAGLVASAGCLDFILGDDDLSFSATKPSVSNAALTETGYQKQRQREETLERKFEAGGSSRTVEVSNWYVEYDRTIDLSLLGGEQRATTFTAITTPKAKVLGQTFNPIDDMSTKDLVETVQDRYEGFGNLEAQDEQTATLLGKSTTVTRFTGTAEHATGAEIDIELQVTEAVGSNGDYALTYGAYPQRIADSEREHYFTLLGGVEHDG